MWGAKMAGKLLPKEFYIDVEAYLQAYKRKVADGRGMLRNSVRTPFH